MTASIVPFPICTGPFGSLQQPPATLPSPLANRATSSGRQPIVGGNYNPSTVSALVVRRCKGEWPQYLKFARLVRYRLGDLIGSPAQEDAR